MNKLFKEEQGQGLIEYGLTIILIAVVVMLVVTMLGPQIGGIFSRVVTAVDGGVLVNATALRTGKGTGNDVVVSISVTDSTTVTITDSQSGQTVSVSCSGSCQTTLTGVGPDAGTVSLKADGDSMSVGYKIKSL